MLVSRRGNRLGQISKKGPVWLRSLPPPALQNFPDPVAVGHTSGWFWIAYICDMWILHYSKVAHAMTQE